MPVAVTAVRNSEGRHMVTQACVTYWVETETECWKLVTVCTGRGEYDYRVYGGDGLLVRRFDSKLEAFQHVLERLDVACPDHTVMGCVEALDGLLEFMCHRTESWDFMEGGA